MVRKQKTVPRLFESFAYYQAVSLTADGFQPANLLQGLLEGHKTVKLFPRLLNDFIAARLFSGLLEFVQIASLFPILFKIASTLPSCFLDYSIRMVSS